jgi:hypothetical protein
MVNKGTGSRRGEANGERIPGVHVRSGSPLITTPARHAVEVAVQLDAVPVDRGGVLQVVDDGDLNRLAPRQHDRWPRDLNRVGTRWRAILEYEAHSRSFEVSIS